MNIPSISYADLRKLAIARQFPENCSLEELVRQLGCVQLDPISAVERSHWLVLWSRLGHFERVDFDNLLWEARTLFEYWAHAASIVSMHDYPVHQWYMRYRQQNEARWREWVIANNLQGLTEYVLEELGTRGPLFSRDIDDHSPRFDSRWWSGRQVPHILQHLWTRGDVMIVGRQGKQRLWGLSENFLPEWVVTEPAWTDEQVTRYAAQVAIRALGAATPRQINFHYTRSRYPDLKNVLSALVEEGILQQITVDEALYYIHAEDLPLLGAIQRGEWQATRTTLLSPFDNLICDRQRTQQLFDFRYRIEIYVPADKREYGYYVLPILHQDRLIGRIDPKFERKSGTLHINAVYREADAPRNPQVIRAIRSAVESLAGFIGARDIAWGVLPDEWAALKQG